MACTGHYLQFLWQKERTFGRRLYWDTERMVDRTKIPHYKNGIPAVTMVDLVIYPSCPHWAFFNTSLQTIVCPCWNNTTLDTDIILMFPTCCYLLADLTAILSDIWVLSLITLIQEPGVHISCHQHVTSYFLNLTTDVLCLNLGPCKWNQMEPVFF